MFVERYRLTVPLKITLLIKLVINFPELILMSKKHQYFFSTI
jgi:hypothetical protein